MRIITIHRYGIAIRSDNPWKEQLNQQVIRLTNNHPRIVELERKWFQHIEGVSGDDQVDIPAVVYLVPSLVGVTLLTMAVAWLYEKYEDKMAKYKVMKRDLYGNDYGNDYQHLLKTEDHIDYIHRGNSWHIDQVLVPRANRTLRVLYEIALALGVTDSEKIKKLSHGLVPKRLSTISRRQLMGHTCEDDSKGRDDGEVEMGEV